MPYWFPFDQRPSFVSCDAVVFSVDAGFTEVDFSEDTADGYKVRTT